MLTLVTAATKIKYVAEISSEAKGGYPTAHTPAIKTIAPKT
jgi:hypothetical protein